MPMPISPLKFPENIRFEEPPLLPEKKECTCEGICECVPFPFALNWYGSSGEKFTINCDVQDSILYLWQ